MLLLAAVVFAVLHKVFAPGFLVYRDQPAHLGEAHAFVEHLRQGGSVSGGWSMENSAGYPLLLYSPKIGYWLVAALHFLLSFSVNMAYKFVVFLSILLPLIGAFFLVRKDGLVIPSLFCSLLFLFQNNLIHYSLSGMGSNALATGVLFLFGRVLFAFTDKPTHKNSVAAGLLLGVLVLTHPYIAMGGIILWGIVFVTFLILSGGRQRLRSLYLLMVPVIGFLVSRFYTMELARASKWLVPGSGELPLLSSGRVIGNLFWKGDFLSHGKGAAAVVNTLGNAAIIAGVLFAILGLGYAFDRKKKGKGFTIRVISMLLFMGVASLVASGIIVPGVGLKGKWLGGLDFIRSTKIHGYRFLVLARVGMVYLSAYGLSRLIQDRKLPAIGGLGKFSLAGRFRWPILIPIGGIVLLGANLPFFFHERTLAEIRRNPFFPARDSALLTTSSSLPVAKDLMKTCDWLRENGEEGNRRVFFQNTLGNALLEWRDVARAEEEGMSPQVLTREDTVTHFTHLPAICPVYTRTPQIGSWIGGNLYPIEKMSISESGMFFGSRVEELDDLDLVLKKRYLQRLNIRYLVSCEPRLRMRLMSSRCFVHRESIGAFDIFELPEVFFTLHKPGWAYFSLPTRYIPNNKLEVTRFDNGGIDVSFENYATIIDLHVAVCHHPYWKAWVDGKPIAIEADEIGLMKIALRTTNEGGRSESLMGKHKLKLRFTPDGGRFPTISLCTSVLCILILLVPRFRKKQASGEEEEVTIEPPGPSEDPESSSGDSASDPAANELERK